MSDTPEFVPGQLSLVHGPRCRLVALSPDGPWAVVSDVGAGWCVALMPDGGRELYREGCEVPAAAFSHETKPVVSNE